MIKLKNWVSGALLAALLLESTGCGYVLYPERRGQKSGSIDPAVLIMDGLGLFIWVVPGVVALAVDFTTGAIYHGGGKKGASLSDADVQVIKVDPNDLRDVHKIEAIISEQTGQSFQLNNPELRSYALTQGQDPALMVAVANAQIQNRL